MPPEVTGIIHALHNRYRQGGSWQRRIKSVVEFGRESVLADDDDGHSDLKGTMAVVMSAIMAIVPELYVFWWATQRICLPLP